MVIKTNIYVIATDAKLVDGFPYRCAYMYVCIFSRISEISDLFIFYHIPSFHFENVLVSNKFTEKSTLNVNEVNCFLCFDRHFGPCLRTKMIGKINEVVISLRTSAQRWKSWGSPMFWRDAVAFIGFLMAKNRTDSLTQYKRANKWYSHTQANFAIIKGK